MQRAIGDVRIAVRRLGGETVPAVLFQQGAGRVRLPRVAGSAQAEAVLMNTAGGMTGGDRFSVEVDVAADAALAVTTQANEKVYRSAGGDATMRVRLRVAAAGSLDWIPQPTILFDRSRLDRSLDVDLHGSARFVACEACIFGRTARGERMAEGLMRDRWRVRRDGRLVFVDALRLEGAVGAALDGPATLGGAVGVATVFAAGPGVPDLIERVRGVLDAGSGPAGASTFDGLLVARVTAPDGRALLADLVRLLSVLRGRDVPRVWSC